MPNERDRAKILFYDIEATNLSANFGYVICIGYKWQHEKKAHIISLTDFPRFKKDVTDDSEVLKAFSKVFNEADIAIHHYGDRFDLPYLQTRLLIHRLPLLSEPATIDTWRTLKYRLKLTSNRLATAIATFATKTQKTPLTGPIWVKAAAGDKKSIEYVKEHCDADVYALEEVYERIKGLIRNHPTTASIHGYCPVCDGAVLKSKGLKRTAKSVYQRLRCPKCGHTEKGRKL